MFSIASLRLSRFPWLAFSECSRRGILFLGMWLFIASVSVHDGYLVAVYRNVIADTECNPLGRHLLELGDGDIWYFLGAKAAGTILACTRLLVLLRSHWMGSVVATCLATFQLWLLVHLTFF